MQPLSKLPARDAADVEFDGARQGFGLGLVLLRHVSLRACSIMRVVRPVRLVNALVATIRVCAVCAKHACIAHALLK